MNEEAASSVDVVAQAPPLRRRETALALAVIAVVGVFFGLPSLPEPFGVDQGIYGYIGERLLEGAVDHRDVFDHKPPGIHFAYATAFALFGHAMWSVRLLDLFAAIATACSLWAFARRFGGQRTGLIAGLLYVAYYANAFDWMSRAQPETWVNLTFVVALAMIAGPRNWPRTLAAGALLGVGFWFKPTIVLPALVWAAVLTDRAVREPIQRWARFQSDLLLAVAGGFAISGVVILYYASQGALRDLYEAVFLFNLRHHNRFHMVRDWPQFGKAVTFILRPLYAAAFLGLLAAAIAAMQKRWRSVALGLAWLILAFATVFWQAGFAKSHYVLVLPPMVFLASLGLDGAIEIMTTVSRHDTPKRAVSWCAITLGFCLILLNLVGLSADRWAKFLALAGGSLAREKYYATFWHKGAPGKGGYSFQDLRDLAAYLEQQTTPDQTVYVWGFRPLIAYLAHRRMPTRFIFRYPLTRTNDPRWWAEFLSALERSRPAYFVVMLDDRGLYHPETSKEALENNAALSLFLHGRYELDRTMSDFEIYRLREAKR
jgi:4-amino-4-deoxy-L-arabinose transferase-like glycosyltransferase